MLNKRPFQDYFWAAIFLAGLLLLFFARQIVGGEALLASDLIFQLDPVWQASAPDTFTIPDNELLSDQVYQFYPWSHYTFASLHSDRFPPLWNPYSYAGAPFLANAQTALFSPFRLLSYLFSLENSFLVLAIAQLFVAGYGTYLFGRASQLSHTAALLAMITFTFSGPVLVWLLYPLSLTFVWLPLVLWATECLLVSKSWRAAFGLAFVLGCQFLGGNPEASFYLLVLWASYIAFRLWMLASGIRNLTFLWRQNRAILLKFTVAFVLGFGLAAIQLLPFLAYLPHSAVFIERTTAASGKFWQTVFLSWHAWPDLITAVFPRFFGSPVNRGYWFPYSNYATQTMYVGLIPLFFVWVTAVPFWQGRRRDAKSLTAVYFLLLGILCLAVAIQLPLVQLVNQLPLFNLARPDRLKVEYAFCLALVAGFGFDFLQEQWRNAAFSAPLWRKIRLSSLSLLGIGLVVVIASYVGLSLFREQIIQMGESQVIAAKQQGNILFPESLDYYLQQVAIKFENMRALFTVKTVVMFLPILVGACILGTVQARSRLSWRQWAYLVLVVTAVDLFAVHINYMPAITPKQIFPLPEIIANLPDDIASNRLTGLDLALMPNSSLLFEIADIRGYDPMTPWRSLQLLQSANGYQRVSHYALFQSPDKHLFDLFNVAYLVTRQTVDTSEWEPISQTEAGITIYQNRTTVSRAYLVTEAVFVDSAAASLQLVTAPEFDVTRQVVLEGAPEFEVKPRAEKVGNASINIYEPERVEIETISTQPAYLVLSDAYMPGWKVFVDGEEKALHVANHAFRAVLVPAGEHVVLFEYKPISFAIGRFISGGVLILLALNVFGLTSISMLSRFKIKDFAD